MAQSASTFDPLVKLQKILSTCDQATAKRIEDKLRKVAFEEDDTSVLDAEDIFTHSDSSTQSSPNKFKDSSIEKSTNTSPSTSTDNSPEKSGQVSRNLEGVCSEQAAEEEPQDDSAWIADSGPAYSRPKYAHLPAVHQKTEELTKAQGDATDEEEVPDLSGKSLQELMAEKMLSERKEHTRAHLEALKKKDDELVASMSEALKPNNGKGAHHNLLTSMREQRIMRQEILKKMRHHREVNRALTKYITKEDQ